MTVEVWGVDQDLVESYHAQLVISASSPLTATRMAEVVKGAAGRVNTRLAAIPGLTVSDLTADTTTETYERVQKLIVDLAAPDLWAVNTPGSPYVTELREVADAEWDEFSLNASAYIGWVVAGDSGTALTHSSTSGLGLSMTDYSQRERREFDGRTNHPAPHQRSLDEGGGRYW